MDLPFQLAINCQLSTTRKKTLSSLSFFLQKGFTMIELLVVIAVIGVLAVAVLSSINPIEQINKGRDTRTRSDAAQLINAVDRFYAIHELYPWNDATYATSLSSDGDPEDAFPDGTVCTANADGMCELSGNTDWLDALTDTAEVKEGFVNRLETANNPLLLAKDTGYNETLYVCFTPTSKAFEQEAITACIDHASTLPAGACKNGPYDSSSSYTDELICLP